MSDVQKRFQRKTIYTLLIVFGLSILIGISAVYFYFFSPIKEKDEDYTIRSEALIAKMELQEDGSVYFGEPESEMEEILKKYFDRHNGVLQEYRTATQTVQYPDMTSAQDYSAIHDFRIAAEKAYIIELKFLDDKIAFIEDGYEAMSNYAPKDEYEEFFRTGWMQRMQSTKSVVESLKQKTNDYMPKQIEWLIFLEENQGEFEVLPNGEFIFSTPEKVDAYYALYHEMKNFENIYFTALDKVEIREQEIRGNLEEVKKQSE